MAQDYDVVIIGAGPAGLSFARSLSELPLKVLILERSSLATLQNPPEDGREIALTHLSVSLMKGLGAWERLPKEEVSPIEGAKVFDGESSYSLNFERDKTELEALGYLVPNHLIRKAFYESVLPKSNIELRTEATVEGAATEAEFGVVTLVNGETVTAKLVIAADTRFSDMRRKMGLSATMKDFSRTAIVCRMSHSKSHQQTAFECFHYGQTTAILPMTGNRSSIVVTVNSRDAQRYVEMSPEHFNQCIEQQLNGMLGDMVLLGKRHVYPLVAVHANQFVARRFAVIGDAAVGMHPVTAHGFNLGLRGQASLAKHIAEAIADGRDIGSDVVLKAYERDHIKVTRVLYHGSNVVVGLFTHETFAAKLARKATLRLANNIVPVKKWIMQSLTEEQMDETSPMKWVRPLLPPRPSLTHLNSVFRHLPDPLAPLKKHSTK